MVIIFGGFMMTFSYYIIINTVIHCQQETKKYSNGGERTLEKSDFQKSSHIDLANLQTENPSDVFQVENKALSKGSSLNLLKLGKSATNLAPAHKVSVEEKWLILNGLVISLL